MPSLLRVRDRYGSLLAGRCSRPSLKRAGCSASALPCRLGAGDGDAQRPAGLAWLARWCRLRWEFLVRGRASRLNQRLVLFSALRLLETGNRPGWRP